MVVPVMRHITVPGEKAIPVLGQEHLAHGRSAQCRRKEIAALRLGLDVGMTVVDTAEMYAEATRNGSSARRSPDAATRCSWRVKCCRSTRPAAAPSTLARPVSAACGPTASTCICCAARLGAAVGGDRGVRGAAGACADSESAAALGVGLNLADLHELKLAFPPSLKPHPLETF
jgi:hypothetical protein